jgi:hypothetical protein
MLKSPLSGRPSLTRLAACACVASACFVGIYGVIHDREHGTVVSALAVGAGVALFLRDRETPEESE